MLPLALLIALGLAGLRGTVASPHWNGPWQRDGLVVGLALELVLAVLLVITVRRRAVQARAALAGGPVNPVAAKLRAVLLFALSAGMAAVAVTIVIGLHLRVFTVRPGLRRPAPRSPQLPPHSRPAGSSGSAAFHFPVAILFYTLLVVLLAAAVVASIWWSRRFRPPGQAGPGGIIVADAEDLREAVESGRSALQALDDARAAIIACYLAMEAHLAERGTTRAVADTPDELLARARSTGLVRGTAAARLTALFYEARFSSHPLDRSQRDAAAAGPGRTRRRAGPHRAGPAPGTGPAPDRRPAPARRRRDRRAGGRGGGADGTVSPWRGTAPELVTAGVLVVAAAAAGYATAGWAGWPWWRSRRRRSRCSCCARCCRS